MAISGLQVINIGEQNESAGSDSLYVAFTKTKTNFETLFNSASPYNTFIASNGISVSANASTGVVSFTNTGVKNIIAGSGVVLANDNGNVTISAAGEGIGTGTVTSVAVSPVSTSRLTVTGSPIISSGEIMLDLATSGVVSGTYTYPTVTVDAYGRITTIASGNTVGTVTSVGVNAGTGIQVTGSPITSSGTINIENVGVTKLIQGEGILLTGATGEITISSVVKSGTVTSVGVSSSTLTISNSPITTSGTISIDLPTNLGNITANVITSNVTTPFAPFIVKSNVMVANLKSAYSNVANIALKVSQFNPPAVADISPVSGYILYTLSSSAGPTPELSAANVYKHSSLSILNGAINYDSFYATKTKFGYTTGTGNTVTQATSRTTGVTINYPSGAITLVSAAGTSAAQTFTVTNSKVSATDVIIVNQKSGTDKYYTYITNVADGGFNITYATTGGTTTEQPVFNFAVIKGSVT